MPHHEIMVRWPHASYPCERCPALREDDRRGRSCSPCLTRAAPRRVKQGGTIWRACFPIRHGSSSIARWPPSSTSVAPRRRAYGAINPRAA